MRINSTDVAVWRADMDKVELMTNRQYLAVKDIAKIFDCSNGTAQRVMREIKAYSDIAKIKGKVTITDYEAWFNRPMEQSNKALEA